jgi:hypothetical protein
MVYAVAFEKMDCFASLAKTEARFSAAGFGE